MFLGIDLGTSSVKVALLDAEGGVRASSSERYDVLAPQPGWAETHPEAWWAAVVAAVNRLDADARRSVKAIGFSGQMHGVVLCDAQARPLRRAILWLDSRGKQYLDAFPADFAARSGNAPAAGMAASTLLWLEQHEPDNYAQARWALQPKDWLRSKMGAPPATDPSEACGTQLADIGGQWIPSLIEALGLRSDWLAPVRHSHAQAGALSAAAAAELALPDGVPLVAGAGDTPAAALGSGLLHEGDAQLSTGTGGQIVVMRQAAPVYAAALNAYRSANPEPHARWYAMAAMLNVGSALEWARGVLNLSWEDAYARAQSAGCAATAFLPYLAGERTPLMETNLRGAWIGLSAASNAADMMRAAFEGVAFSLRSGFDALASAYRPTELRLAGGGSSHPWWRQLLADALGVPLCAAQDPGLAAASARGAALLAGLGVQHWTSADLPRLCPQWTIAAEPRADDALAERYLQHVQARALLQEFHTKLR